MYLNLGIIGHPLEHTLSPRLHSYFMNETYINGGYVCFDTDENEIGELFKCLKRYNFKGINVTVPYKEKIFDFVDNVSKEAQEIGAINTIKFSEDGQTTGYNTDTYGFDEMMKLNEVNPDNRNIIVMGSGGSALTVLYTLKKYNYKKIFLLARNIEKAEKIVNKLNLSKIEIFNYNFLNKSQECDIIINTISLGLKGERFFKMSNVYCNDAIIDLQYKPNVTPFIEEYKNTSVKKINGIGMLILQGYKAFQIWTDKNIHLNFNKIVKLLGADNAVD